MTYYKQIEGVSYDRALIEAAEAAVSGRGDGRISKDDAEKLFALVTDGGRFTNVERTTVTYVREHMKWTDKADAWFREALKKWGDDQGQPIAAKVAQAPKPQGIPAIVVRLGKGNKSASHFPQDALALAEGCAVVIVRKGTLTPQDLWKQVDQHKEKDLPEATEDALVQGGIRYFHSRKGAVAAVLGVAPTGLQVNLSFTNVPAEKLLAGLKALGYEGIDSETVI